MAADDAMRFINHWNHLGILLGIVLGTAFGIILGSLWGSFWHRFGVSLLGLIWGPLLEYSWDRVCDGFGDIWGIAKLCA